MKRLLTIAFLLACVAPTRAKTAVPTVYTVMEGENIQTAIDAAVCGDTIELEAGATFPTAGLVFVDKSCSDYILVTTTNPASIPAALLTYPSSYNADGSFTRLTPMMAAPMPKLVATANDAVLYFNTNAKYWKFVGLELTNDGSVQYNALVQGGSNLSYLYWDQCFLHPIEEIGTMDDITYRSAENAFVINGDHFTWTHNAIQGWTGYNKLPTPSYRLNANSILGVVFTNSLIENNLLEANGQVFVGGGGGIDPAHTATASGTWTYTSGTLTSTTDLDVGDLFSVCSAGLRDNHLQPDDSLNPATYISRVGCYANGRIQTVNHMTGAITFTHLTSGLRYRQFNLYLFGATGGTYTLTWMGQTTAPIAYNADKAAIRTALEALSTVEPDDFHVRNNTTDAWPYADFMINFEHGEAAAVSQWAYPEPINPLVLTSSLTGGNDPGFTGSHSSESYTPLESSEDGVSFVDIPEAGAVVNWEGTQAHDLIVRKNIIAHHPEWTTAVGNVKGFAEQKGCDHCTWDGNIFSGQATGFVFTVRNQGGTVPWASNSYTELTNNVFDQCGGTFAMANTDGAYEVDPTHDVIISNNLCMWPGGEVFNANKWMGLQGGYNFTITHNTVFSPFYILEGISFNPVTSGTLIQDNIFRPGSYPVPCLDGDDPCFPDAVATNNVLLNDAGLGEGAIGGWFSTFGLDSAWLVLTIADVGFVAPDDPDLHFANYRLAADSLYHAGNARDASDGKDVGVDYDQLNTHLGFNLFDAAPPADSTTDRGHMRFRR